jgi:hypothetical protein
MVGLVQSDQFGQFGQLVSRLVGWLVSCQILKLHMNPHVEILQYNYITAGLNSQAV